MDCDAPSAWLSAPPRSQHILAAEPIILETLCFSMYSDISTRIIAFSVPNIASESALESSVFPTPVGPRNRNEPIGRFGSLSPTRPRRIARATADTASSCPTTRSCRMDSSFNSRSTLLLPACEPVSSSNQKQCPQSSFSPTTNLREFFLFFPFFTNLFNLFLLFLLLLDLHRLSH